MSKTIFKLGLIINPYAGIGGSVGLKGSDGEAIRAEALARGAGLRAEPRVKRCLQILESFANDIHIYCFAGDMGETVLRDFAFPYTLVGASANQLSSAQDTIAAAQLLASLPVDLMLFAGGDGTARNIADALQQVCSSQPVLGIPAGVKMHSGVYAISPEAAGQLLAALLSKQLVTIEKCEVRDIDEAAFRQGKVKSQFYGEMHVPVLPQFLQQVKNSGAAQNEMVKLDIANSLIDNLNPETLYIVGPGSTTYAFLQQLGIQGELLGIDVMLNSSLVATDVSSAQLNDLLDEHRGEVNLILTAIGSQGHIIGRGNQQLTPDVLRKVGRKNIKVIATPEKIASLQGRPLLIDSNDHELDKSFSGYQSVLIGYNDFILYPIGTAHF